MSGFEGTHCWEAFANPDLLRVWLALKGLLDGGEAVGEADLVRARDARRALRSLLGANNGGEVDPEAVDALNLAAERAMLTVRFGPEGRSALETGTGGWTGPLARFSWPPTRGWRKALGSA